MQNKDNFYHNAGFWFLLFIVLVFAGFYHTYFSTLLISRPLIIHIHFTVMMIWIAVIIIQPLLIKYKKRHLHRVIGRWSYVLVPIVLFFSFLVIRLEYYTRIKEHIAEPGSLQLVASNPNGLFFFLWFAIFYALAILNRRKSSVHARFMFATSLGLLGPTVDRILQINFHIRTFAGGIPALVISFLSLTAFWSSCL